MKLLHSLLIDNFVHSLGWTLMHSLWQILAIAAMAAFLLARLHRATASARYAVACIALVGMFLVVPFTLVYVLSKGTPTPAIPPADSTFNPATESMWTGPTAATVPSSRSDVAVDWPRALYNNCVERLDIAAPYLAFVWLAGFALLSLGTGVGCLSARQLTRSGIEALHDRYHATISRLVGRIGIKRPLQALASVRVDVPCIVGWMRPVLLVPICLLAEMPPRQLEALLAHELAHMRRHDYLINLLQRLIESAIFYHPAVWWLSRRIREERENCCDDIAVACCGDARDYAGALARLEESRAAKPNLALAASAGNLLSRIRRLVAPGAVPQTSTAPAMLSAIIIIGIFLAAGAKWVQAERLSATPTDGRAGMILFADSNGAPSIKPTTPAQRAVADRLSERIAIGDQDVQLREVVARLSRATSLRIVCPLGSGLLDVHGQFGARPLSDELTTMLSPLELGCLVEANGVLRIIPVVLLTEPIPGMVQFAARLNIESLRRNLFEGKATSVSELIEQLDQRAPAVVSASDREKIFDMLRVVETILPAEMAMGTIRIQAERRGHDDSSVRFAVELSGMCRMPGATAEERAETIANFKKAIETAPALNADFEPSARISIHDGAAFVNPQPNLTAFSLVLLPRAL